MRKYLIAGIAFGALLFNGCSQGTNGDTYEAAEVSADYADASYDEAEVKPSHAPDISITAAPGVAFNYRYEFRVPDSKIAGVQEVHAAACETLGVNRCRITGMRYRLFDEKRVGASLNFKLDPVIARKFGKDAIASVEKAQGILVDSAIEGIDEGAKIASSKQRAANASSNLSKLEEQLKNKKLGDRERAALQQQVNNLNRQLDNESANQNASEESLASTPMSISYNGGKNIPGFENGNPFANAWDNAQSSFIFMTSLVMLAVGVFLPWALLIFILLLIWRSSPMHSLRKKFSDMRTRGNMADDNPPQES